MSASLSQSSIFMSVEDHEQISALLERHASEVSPERSLIEWKLSQAIQLKRSYMFPDVVSIDSRVNFISLREDLEFWVRLSCPGEHEDKARLSVLSPVGAALIGLSRGQEFHWCGPSGKQSGLRVIEVVQSPCNI
jgi:regulator of nucleoside diphosphate kinase